MLLATLVLSACVASTPPAGSFDDSSASNSTHASTAGQLTSSSAADYFKDNLAALDKTLYVYRDFADGLNTFTQKAWMGSNSSNVPAMDEAAGAYSGISSIAAELDLTNHSWGGYMFLNGSLAAGHTQPVADFGQTDCGLDLSGATKLAFYAKGETGKEQVEFFMGGMGWDRSLRNAQFPDSTQKVSLGTVSLSAEWQRFEIDLTGKDLSRIGCGFGWVTNDVNNPGLSLVRFYVDDIHYEFAEHRITPLFLQSYASAAPGTDEAIINNFAYLYDNAAAALALSYAEEHERAQQITDAIVYALENDRAYSDGRLRNAYSSGDPHSFKGWFSVKGEEFARIPGFYDPIDQTWYEDYFAVSTATGNLAWAMLALCEVYENAPERTDYLDAARTIGDFILTLKSDTGGFTAGYEGWEGSEVKVGYKSTEHNIDLISAYGQLAKLTGESQYTGAAAHAKAFVLAMYDADRHCFYTGTAEDGVTISKDVLPLDCNTWAILALGKEFTDGTAVMDFVEHNMRTDNGYDFNTDTDGVWFEGTAQVALAYRQIGDAARAAEICAWLNTNELPDGSIPAADRNAVSTGFIVSGTGIPWNYENRPHVGATAWLAFVQMERNPFEAIL
jgi:hypothetical protein